MSKANRKLPWFMQFRAFCSEASVAGLRYVANPSASVFRRSIWLLFVIAGAGFTAYQITSRVMYYLSYPTSVNIRVEHEPVMRFPSVTICNENIVTLSGATSLGKLAVIIIHCILARVRKYHDFFRKYQNIENIGPISMKMAWL